MTPGQQVLKVIIYWEAEFKSFTRGKAEYGIAIVQAV